MSNHSAEEERECRQVLLPKVQEAIEKDRNACIRLQELLVFLIRTFSSTTSAGATPGAMVRNVSDALKRASRFADPSVLPRDITQLVMSSLDRLRGSFVRPFHIPIVEEITGILDNLKCPCEAEIEYLVLEILAKGRTLGWGTTARVLEDSFDSVEMECHGKKSGISPLRKRAVNQR